MVTLTDTHPLVTYPRPLLIYSMVLTQEKELATTKATKKNKKNKLIVSQKYGGQKAYGLPEKYGWQKATRR